MKMFMSDFKSVHAVRILMSDFKCASDFTVRLKNVKHPLIKAYSKGFPCQTPVCSNEPPYQAPLMKNPSVRFK